MSATMKLGFPQQYVHVEMAQSEKKKKNNTAILLQIQVKKVYLWLSETALDVKLRKPARIAEDHTVHAFS